MISPVALALILIPATAGLMAFGWRGDFSRRALLVGTALAHAVLTAYAWTSEEPLVLPPPQKRGLFDGWLHLDSTGLVFLSVLSLLYLVTSIYLVGYLARKRLQRPIESEEGFLAAMDPEASFTGCILLFLASMTAVCCSTHFGLLWVTIEATTLASAPLINFDRHAHALEATWKYLLLCSVGIALALLGNFLLAVAADRTGNPGHTHLVLYDLLAEASKLDATWLQASFLLFLVGYGTKMGLAPMHSWKPDAYTEAPSAVAVLLSGALANCALLGILRAQQVCVAAGQNAFTSKLLVGFGVVSMTVAAVFILGQVDFKRMLAYSSIEHMGVLVLGVGLGGVGAFGALLHAINHSLAKGCLFFAAGNIVAHYRSKQVSEVAGVLRVLPLTGVLWLFGLLAITGSPPLGMFLSEFTILKAALDADRVGVAVAYLGLLCLIFIGMAQIVLQMAQGQPNDERVGPPAREPLWSILPPTVLGLLTLALGIYIPPQMVETLQAVARTLGGS